MPRLARLRYPGPLMGTDIIRISLEGKQAMAIVAAFILGGSKITADGYCSHEIKTLTPWWEAQSSPRVARESWGWRSSHCRA